MTAPFNPFQFSESGNSQKLVPSKNSWSPDITNEGDYTGGRTSTDCGCPVEGCKISVAAVTQTKITNIIINLQQSDVEGNWSATNPPYFGSIQPSCVPCESGLDAGIPCACRDVEVTGMPAVFTLPPLKDCDPWKPFRLRLQLTGLEECAGTFELPEIFIFGDAGWLSLEGTTYQIIEGSNEFWGCDLTRDQIEFVCRAGNNYEAAGLETWSFLGTPTNCDGGGIHLATGSGAPPTGKPYKCGGPACQYDHEPSSSECNRTQNVVTSHLGELGVTHIPCTCYSCDDKCQVLSWTPPEGWQKGIVTCAYPGALELDQYYPNGPGDFVCTISRCNPCYETYGPQTWPIKHTEPCVGGLYLGTSNGEPCWTVDCPCAETYSGGTGIDSDFDFWCERSTTGYRERFDGGAWVETTFPCSCS